MKKTGWQGGTNPFIIPMQVSVENAINITDYHLNILDARKGDGAGFLAMYNDFEPTATIVINLGAKKTGDLNAQVQLTDIFENEFADMGEKLDGFDTLTRAIHPVNTDPYNLIWGNNRNRFYRKSYQNRLGALKGLADEMTTQGVPLGAAAVNTYRGEIITKHKIQVAKIATVGTDATALTNGIKLLTKKLNKNRGWLLFNYAESDDCQKQVNAFFPLNLLGDRSVKGHYQLIVPKANFRRICIHTFKEGEKIEITVGNADLWISTADNANSPINAGYRALKNTIVTIDPALLGDLTKKFIIATNDNLTTSCDLIFNIVKG